MIERAYPPVDVEAAAEQAVENWSLEGFRPSAISLETLMKHIREAFAGLVGSEPPVIRCRSCGGTPLYKRTAEGFEIIHDCTTRYGRAPNPPAPAKAEPEPSVSVREGVPDAG
jgi:hypothetical protein